MGKLSKMDVLIVGQLGVGVEVAKSVTLAGPRSVTLFDPVPVEPRDVGRNYYFTPADVEAAVPRAAASAARLSELNPHVKVHVLSGSELTEAAVASFSAVVFTLTSRAEQLRWNEFCRTRPSPIAFMACDVRGVTGYAFTDFGPEHVVRDADGEANKSAIVIDIERANPAVVFTHDTKRHGFSNGDWVTFSEVEGAVEANEGGPFQITDCKPNSFVLQGVDATSWGEYAGGGVVEQTKVPTVVRCMSLAEAVASPAPKSSGMMLTPDVGKFGRPEQLHIAYSALAAFEAAHGRLPGVHDAADAAEVVSIAKAANAHAAEAGQWSVETVDDDVVSRVAELADTELAAMCAFFGGLVAQEVVKVTGKFSPLDGWLYLDAFEVLPTATDADGDEKMESGSGEEAAPSLAARYSDVNAIFGERVQRDVANTRTFLVGAGALGCEFLKNFAMMGLGTGPRGVVSVTDMDRIESSNLNRQFLFRERDLGQPKSITAAAAARAMNPGLRVEAFETPVGPDTEGTFDDAFWEGLDIVTNALDNVKARLYVDGRCVLYELPLLESGTLGTKANTQVVVPHLTESYGDAVDPPEESIPMCTLKNFPNQIEHCIEWARDLFEGCFSSTMRDAASFLSDPSGALADIRREGNASQRRLRLERVLEALESARAHSFVKCVEFARTLYHESYYTNIMQLLYNFPADYVDRTSGAKFWSGPKRAPHALDFSLDDPTDIGFVVAASHLAAATFGVSLPENSKSPEVLSALLDGVHVPPFAPKVVKIKTGDDDEAVEGGDDDDDVAADLAARLEAFSRDDLRGLVVVPAEFEKDDDTNFHVDFVTAAANLRARNYAIREATRHQAKMIAGRIIPAVATTTCMVTGLVCLEMYKVLQRKKLEAYRNNFVNLAVNVYAVSEPGEPKRVVSKDFDPVLGGPVHARPEGFTSWDKLVIREGELTCQGLVEYFARQDLTLTMIASGSFLLYAPLMNASHRTRSDKQIKDVYANVSRAPLPAGRKYIMLDVVVEDGECDVSVPVVQYFYA